MESINSKMLILADELNFYFQNKNKENNQTALEKITRYFPSLSLMEVKSIFELLEIQWGNAKISHTSSEIVVTLPREIEHNFRRTVGVLREYILSAEKTILVTGYAISDYVQDIIELLTYKSSQGVEVTFLIDRDINEMIFKNVDESLNFKVYKFNTPNNHAHLHAKVLIFDSKRAFISSSNLSYNGILNNIEVGTLVSDTNVKELEHTLIKLIESPYFNRIK